MRRLYQASLFYLIVGLVAGVIYREVTRWLAFTGTTKLSLLHAHTLVLGMLFFLIALLLEKQFQLTKSRHFKRFFWTYNAGLVVTIGLMAFIGTQQLLGNPHISGMVAGISGLGHILLAVGLGFFFAALGERVKKAK
ncbi:MAG: DUF2871 domain-containing protein [Candidatus Saccharibacteria bacterium]|nr:DUF2871 domain-containing protein [Candidatus Saccharibacteria bacterium]